MIASIASTTSLTRAATDDAKQGLEASTKAKAAAALATEQESAVVKISQQGAEQAGQATPPSSPEPSSAGARPKPVDSAANNAANSAANSTTRSASAAPKSNKPALAYEAADTDTDGKISAFEQQSYDFRHPELRAYAAVAKEGAAPGLNVSAATSTDTTA